MSTSHRKLTFTNKIIEINTGNTVKLFIIVVIFFCFFVTVFLYLGTRNWHGLEPIIFVIFLKGPQFFWSYKQTTTKQVMAKAKPTRTLEDVLHTKTQGFFTSCLCLCFPPKTHSLTLSRSPSSREGHESAALAYLGHGLLTLELLYITVGACVCRCPVKSEVSCVWRSGCIGRTITVAPGGVAEDCWKPAPWKIGSPENWDASWGYCWWWYSGAGDVFKSGFDWFTLASISECSLEISVSSTDVSSLSSFFSVVNYIRRQFPSQNNY